MILGDAMAVGQVGLLVVDMARSLADPVVADQEAGPSAAMQCRRVLEAARSVGLPVWFSRGGKRWFTSTGSPAAVVERGGWVRMSGLVEQSPEQAELAITITPQLEPELGEVVITKSKPSAFFGTPLISQLMGARVDRLIVVEMATSCCVRATITDAFSYDLNLVVPVECVADRDPAAHEANLRDIGSKYATLCNTDELIAELTSPFALHTN